MTTETDAERPRTALITGGTSGIGEAIARLLLDRGCRVAVTGRDPGRLRGVADRLDPGGGRLLTVVADPADWGAVSSAVQQTVERFGGLDVAVANAGFAIEGDVVAADPEVSREMVLVNVLGPALLVKAAAGPLARARGRIVIVGSVAGHKNVAGSLYAATKAAMTSLAENARMRLSPDGIGVVLVSPGAVLTEFWRNSRRPPANALTADAIAEAVVWAVEQPDTVDISTLVVRPRGEGL